jgi:catechol 2,3-dioxygenase-like lactoylglutathione lyase family enzyme
MLAHPMTEASESLIYIAPVLRVSDVSRSLAFYRDRLGFAVEFLYEAFYAGVCRDACHIHFKCSAPPPRDQTAFEREEHIDIYISVQSA